MAATAVFDADDSQYQAVAARIIAVLERLEKLFASKDLKIKADGGAVHSEIDRINARFAGIAAHAQSTTGAFGAIAGGASLITTAVGAISAGLQRVIPLVKYIPDSFARWVPAVKAAVAEHERLASVIGAVSGAASALRGRLTLVDALFVGMHAHTLGATKAMATLGAVGAFATSKLVAGLHAAGRGLGSLLGHVRNAAVGLIGLGGGAGGALIPFAVGGAAASAAIGGLAAGIFHAMDAAGAFLDQSFNTGAKVRDLVILTQEFKNAGKAGEDVTPVISKMQDVLARGTANDTIARLGLDLAALRGMTPVAQFHALGAAINGIGDASDRARAAREIFGKSGSTLLSMFASGGFGDAAAEVGRQAELLQQDAGLFDYVSDKLHTSGLKVQGFFIGVADRVAPVLKPLLEQFGNLDLAAMGQRVGDLIAMLATAIGDGRITDLTAAALEVAILEAGNLLIGLMMAAGPVLQDGMILAAGAFILLMLIGVGQIITKLSGIPGLGKLVTSDAQAIVGGVSKGVANHGAAALAGIGNVRVFDSGEARDRLGSQAAALMATARAQQAAALAAVPTPDPKTGVAGLLGNEASAVTALQRIGGGFGASGGTGDPLIEANRLAATGNDWLARIYQAVAKDTPAPASSLLVYP